MENKPYSTSRNLDDDYELAQLNPTYGGVRKQEKLTEVVQALESMPEQANMKMRIATFEAIMDQVAEDAVQGDIPAEECGSAKGATDGPSPSELSAFLNKIADKAIALHKVPSLVKDRIPAIVARKLKIHNPMFELTAKAAKFVTDACVEVSTEDTVIEEELGSKPGDDGVNAASNKPLEHTGDSEQSIKEGINPTDRWHFEDEAVGNDTIGTDNVDNSPADEGVDIEKEVIEPSGDSVQDTTNAVPHMMRNSMRYLAASAVNVRKATALVSRECTGVLLSQMLHDLRNTLPKSFKRKYGIDE